MMDPSEAVTEVYYVSHDSRNKLKTMAHNRARSFGSSDCLSCAGVLYFYDLAQNRLSKNSLHNKLHEQNEGLGDL